MVDGKDKILSDRIDPALFEKEKRILEIRDEVLRSGRHGKRDFEKIWYRNVLLYIGRHWISWDKGRGRWVDAPGLGKWYPKPVTNKFAESANALKALVVEKKFRPLVIPATTSEEDIATAERGDIWVDVIRDEAKSNLADKMAAAWMIITGNCFGHQYYVMDKESGETFFNYYTCPACKQQTDAAQLEESGGNCPSCQADMSGVGPDVIDGQAQGFSLPKGRLVDDCASPFEMFFNCNVDKFDDVKQIIRAKSVPVSEIENTYPDIKGQVETSTSSDEGASKIYKKALKTVTVLGGGQGISTDGESVPEGDIHYLFCKPDEEFENGLMATIVGLRIVELKDASEYMDEKGVCFSPFSYAGANYIPGCFWGKTRMDDVAQKQFDRNLYESLIQLQLLTMSAGKWLDPGTNMDEPTGEPGQIIRYDWTVENRKPELQQGLSPQAVWIQLIQQIDKEIEGLSASYDVLKGQLPPGLDTFSGLRLLTERAVSVHGEMLDNFSAFQVDKTRKQLELARKHFIEPRTKTIAGENGGFETISFSRADLQGGVDIRIEEGSSIPKSPAVENASIADNIKLGLIDVSDPKIAYKVLEKEGLQDLAAASGEDIKDAMKEWKDFLASVQSAPGDPEAWDVRPRGGIDNEAIHYRDAASRAKTDDFFALPPEAQARWVEHVMYHKANLDAEMAQKAAMAQPKKGMVPV